MSEKTPTSRNGSSSGSSSGPNLSRRGFLGSTGAVTTAMGFGMGEAAAQGVPAVAPAAPPSVTLTVNGKRMIVDIETRTTLLEALRDNPGLTSTRVG